MVVDGMWCNECSCTMIIEEAWKGISHGSWTPFRKPTDGYPWALELEHAQSRMKSAVVRRTLSKWTDRDDREFQIRHRFTLARRVNLIAAVVRRRS